MESHATADFYKMLYALPASVINEARKTYRKWKANHLATSLYFKPVDAKSNTWSVRIGDHYRAFCLKEGNDVTWFWIGPHEAVKNIKRVVKKSPKD